MDGENEKQAPRTLEDRAEELTDLIQKQRQYVEAAIGQLHFLEGGLRMVQELIVERQQKDQAYMTIDGNQPALTLDQLQTALGADKIEVVEKGGSDGETKEE